MKYDFDQEIGRKSTGSVKWEFLRDGEKLVQWDHGDTSPGEDRILPMWVADMDFPCPKPVVDALVARAEHGVYGYTERTDSYYESVIRWMKKRHGWTIAREWICTTPGVVPGLNMLVRTFASSGQKVLIQPPVYRPFFSAIKNNGGQLVSNPLTYQEGRYTMDYADLEEKTRGADVRMAILCSPHNPVGRVWTRDELVRFGKLCLDRDILVVSDEIHGDLILKGHVFTPFATIGEAFAQRSIICTAPSKTFNVAGLQTSNIIIPDDELRARFQTTLRSNGLSGLGVFGLVALQAAYEHGEEWLEQVLDYVEGNLGYLQAYIAKDLPQMSVIRPEGTYLVWLDCRRLGLDKWELKRLMLDKARVCLDEGYIFGLEGEGFERINIACPRSILVEALERIRKAIEAL